ncbi:Sestrin-like protein [Armadillidium vulgare]|nr:Sestrin-like protein [Armadillidium vulgare]
MVHFHALCSLVHGTGMEAANGEPPVQQAEMIQGCTSGSPNSQELSEGGVEVLLDRMKNISRTFDEELPEEQKVQSFEFLKNQTAEVYDYPITIDCSWEEHGFSLLSELYHEVGEILDDKFKTAYNLTYYTCGNKTHVDTYPFRRGVWNYLQCLYGIRHDYYDYRQVNKLLEANLKTFLKMVSCFPERLLPSEHSPPLMKGFLQSEKLHVVILVVEAKLQAELLYALRSIGRYLL